MATVTAEVGKRGTAYVQKLLRSDYGAFWKSFSRSLENDPNVPWEQVEAARLQPEFVGIALSLIRGNDGAREAVRDYFADLELPDTAYEDHDHVMTKVFEAAVEAAHKAPRDDRDASLATERRIEETIRNQSRDAKARITEVGDEVVDKLKEGFAASNTDRRLEQQVETAFQKSEEQQRERAQTQLEKLDDMQSQIERVGEILSASISTQRTEQSPPPLEPAAPEADEPETVPSDSDGSAEDLLKELAKKDSDGAVFLRGLYAKGRATGIVQFLRDQGEAWSVDVLDTAADLVALHGFFSEAEHAHVVAAAKADQSEDRARQLVRAAGMAQIQGADRRYRDHLDRANRVAPDLAAVVIATARSSSDGSKMVEGVEGVEPESGRQRAILHVTRAQGWLLQGRTDLARTELGLAEETGVNTLPVREMRAMVSWVETKEAIRGGREAPRELAHLAAREFEAVSAEVMRQRRIDEAVRLASRAAEAYALADETGKAVQLLEAIQRPETLSLEARESAAEAAIAARRPDLVLHLIETPSDEPSSTDALWADAILQDEDSNRATRERAVNLLLPLLKSSDGDGQAQAAFALLGAAAMHGMVEWNEEAAEIVRNRMPIAEASMRAQVLQREGQFEEAENILLPFAGDPKALRQLRDYAADREDWPKVRARSARLLEISGRPIERLALADSTFKAGEPVKAKEEFLAVARDRDMADQLRGMGYSGAIEIASAAGDYEEIRRLADEWHTQLPADSNGTWNLLFGLARVAQHQAAYQLFQEENPEPDTPQRAALLAEIMGRAAPKIEALEMIAALSDRYDRSFEALEGLFLKVSLDAEQEGKRLPRELEDRIREAWATFPTRFPDQEFMEVIEAPTTWEGFEQLLKDIGGGERARLQVEATEEIIAGERPVNGLAAAAPHGSIGRCWLGLGFLPLGFCIDGIDDLETKAASEAIGGAAVWDSASLFVVGGLGGPHKDTLTGVLPGLQIAIETLEDADAAVDSMPMEGGHETVQDPDTGALLNVREHTKDSTNRLRTVSEGMLKLAQGFEAAPGIGEKTGAELRKAYGKAERRSWRAIIGSLALAERLGLPLFSDDRWIRRAARGLEIEAFGTVALVDALDQKGVLDAGQRQKIRQRLAASGAWGIEVDEGELIAAARDSDWRLSAALRGGLNDRAAWRAKPATYMHAVIGLLAAVYREQPESLGIWLRRVIEAFNKAYPEVRKSRASEVVLLLSWDVQEEPRVSAECFQAILREIRGLPYNLRSDAPVFRAIAEMMDVFNDQPDQLRFLAFMRLISRLSPDDAFAAFCKFAEPGPPIDPPPSR